MEYTSAQKTLFGMLAGNLFSRPFAFSDDTDWEQVYAESRLQAVMLTAFQHHRDLPLGGQTAQTVEKAVQAHTMRNIRVFRHHAYLHALMTKNGIPYCVLKGVSSAYYYPTALLRGMGDVDFFVPPERFDDAVKALTEDGFSVDLKQSDHHAVFRKAEGMHFEMHREPAGIPYGEAGQIIRDYFSDLVTASTADFCEFVSFSRPSAFHHGLVMLLHMQHHLLSEGIGLRHLCDWAVFTGRFSPVEFEAMFEKKLQAVGLWQFAKIVSLASSLYLGLEWADWMGDDTALAHDLMADIVSGGNFGSKDHSRAYEGKMISHRGKDGVKKSRVRVAMESLNRIVRTHFPIVKKLPILYPFLWCFVILRYCFHAMTGKRARMNLLDAYQNSGKRRRLYGRLCLFETKKSTD